MRLIDADAADVEEISCYYGSQCYTEDVQEWLNEQPTIEAEPVVHGHCDWCKPGEELCGTCRMFFDYHGDGGSDKCSSECDSDKCAYYEPIGFCPNCGAKMDGRSEGE